MIRLKLWLAGALAGLLALFGVWTAGRRDGVQKARVQAGKTYIETRKRMDATPSETDASAVRGWLRDRAKSGRDL